MWFFFHIHLFWCMIIIIYFSTWFVFIYFHYFFLIIGHAVSFFRSRWSDNNSFSHVVCFQEITCNFRAKHVMMWNMWFFFPMWAVFPVVREYLFALPPVHTHLPSGGFLNTWRDFVCLFRQALCTLLITELMIGHIVYLNSFHLKVYERFQGMNNTAGFYFSPLFHLFPFLCVASRHLLNDSCGINNTVVLLSFCGLDTAADALPFFVASHSTDFSTFFLFISLFISLFFFKSHFLHSLQIRLSLW